MLDNDIIITVVEYFPLGSGIGEKRSSRKAHTMSPTINLNFILVSGYDFGRIDGAGQITRPLDFGQFSRNRMKVLEGKYVDQDLTFYLVDFGDGSIKKIDVIRRSKSPTTTLYKQKKAIDDRNFPLLRSSRHEVEDRKTLCRYQEEVLSIEDVYSLLKDIEKVAPASVMELSFYSHAWQQGPALANTYLWKRLEKNEKTKHVELIEVAKEKRKTIRDPFDLEPRYNDLIEPSQNKQIGNAFRKDGYIWIWGCNADHAFIQTIKQASRQYPKKGVLSFRFANSWAQEYYGMDRHFFPVASKKDKDGKPIFDEKTELQFQRDINDVVEMIERALRESFGFKLSLAWNCEVRVLPFGCWAWYHSKDKNGKKTMGLSKEVFRDGTPSPNVGNLRFYKDLRRYKFDPETNEYLSLGRKVKH